MKEGIYEDLSGIRARGRIAFLIVKIVFVLLVLTFWKIQILEHRSYWEKSEANRIREMALPPRRGLITDRHGRILAMNYASFQVAIIRENAPDLEESYERVAGVLDLEPSVIRERVAKYASLPDFRPIVIKENLVHAEVARVESRKLEFPELIIQTEPKRGYPNATSAAHVIGYLQEVSPAEIRSERYAGIRAGSLVGKTGIERQYESSLVGRDGVKLEIVDSLGRPMGEISRREPVNGTDLSLTLDLDLQMEAERLLEGREGAVVIMKADSGEILAMASYPTFDPNKFINRFTPEEWLDLVRSREFPLENRAIRGLYSPGSIFKPIMATAGLDAGEVTPRSSFYCSGSVTIYGHPFNCWFRPGHGGMDVTHAIQNSCNIYFYQLGKRLKIEQIAEYARKYGLGVKTGIDLGGEKAGLVPDPQWKRRTQNLPWYPGETISVSIGQGPVLVTPLQAACVTSAIAMRGRRVRPHLVLKESGGSIPPTVDIAADVFEPVIRGMWMSVNAGGTGHAARVDGFDVCGKTGSTQTIGKATIERLGIDQDTIKTHSWFSGFAPRERPEVIVTVLVERGGMGGATAAPIAGRLFRIYRGLDDR